MKRSHFVFLLLVLLLALGVQGLHAQMWCGTIFGPPPPPPPGSPPPCCECGECTKSPNYIGSGNYGLTAADLQLATKGLPLALVRNYDSVRGLDGPFGISWTSNLTGRLSYTTYLYAAPSTYFKEAVIVMPNGRPYRFRENPDGTTYTSVAPSHYTLIRNADGSFDLSPPSSRTRYRYAPDGSLSYETDEWGNTLAFNYDGT